MEGFDSMMRIALQIRWIKGFEIGDSRGEIMEFVPIKEVPNIQNLAIILGCKVENMPTTYLGMPLGSEHKAEEIWDRILEKTEKRLARWKAQYISLGGRLILINFVLDALPTYVMSLFPIPPKVMKKLDRLRRDFLWRGCKEGKGYKLVNWQTTMHSREQGGLGIRNPRAQNNSLLMKWLWRYNRKDHALWREVIRHKFGELNPWCTNVSTDTDGVGAWKTIRALWPKLERNLQKRVGDGKRIKFWKDAWKEQSPLMEIFPRLFILSNNPDATIYDKWSAQGWNLSSGDC
ncbi:hypothetical protein MTR67_000809 [Solanum verrucosum]|uniref:Uncharacterized protein n=1 Tax=Solanum verrucosum TaxID=315347 RepID=A0AAF0PM16_SOLVR|nr:hypothetical protein MTR67_000809 [Solanum verrucosum]